MARTVNDFESNAIFYTTGGASPRKITVRADINHEEQVAHCFGSSGLIRVDLSARSITGSFPIGKLAELHVEKNIAFPVVILQLFDPTSKEHGFWFIYAATFTESAKFVTVPDSFMGGFNHHKAWKPNSTAYMLGAISAIEIYRTIDLANEVINASIESLVNHATSTGQVKKDDLKRVYYGTPDYGYLDLLDTIVNQPSDIFRAVCEYIHSLGKDPQAIVDKVLGGNKNE